MRGFEALAEAVAAEGVEVIFGVLGGSNERMVNELVWKHRIRFVPTRHEQGAVGMADGYSRATGKLGVATVEKGPGLTNTATAMTAARLSRSAVLLIAGDKVIGSRFGNMDIDQPPFIHATAGAMQQANTPETLADDVRIAFRHVRLGLGPMVLNVPTSLSESALPEGWRYRVSADGMAGAQAPAPDPQRVAAVEKLLRESRRPVVLAGRGAVNSEAREALIALADRVGGVLVTTLQAKGWFGGHPFNLGISGGFAPSQARSILNRADLVLAFGAGLNAYTLDHGRLYPSAKLVQVDINPTSVGALTPVDEVVVGDARTTAEALLEALPQEAAQGWRTAELSAEIEGIDPWADLDFTDRPGYVNRHELVRICEEMLPRERLLAVGIGHFMGSPAAHISVPSPRDQVLPWRLGAIGSGLPAAIGAAVGRPDRLTVVFEGDVSFMMTLQEFETAARCQIPLVVIIENDQGNAAERIAVQRRGENPALADFANPDFAAIARAFGGEGHTVKGADELRQILGSMGRPKGPVLIDVAISPQEADVRMIYIRTGGPV